MDAISQLDSQGLIFAGVIFLGFIMLLRPVIEAAVNKKVNPNGKGYKEILQSMSTLETALRINRGVDSYETVKKDLADILDKVNRLEKAFLGNGAPGMKTRIALAEHRIKNLEEENV